MSESSRRGEADHRLVHGFEVGMKRLEPIAGRVAAIKYATGLTIAAEARRWWEQRGYKWPEEEGSTTDADRV